MVINSNMGFNLAQPKGTPMGQPRNDLSDFIATPTKKQNKTPFIPRCEPQLKPAPMPRGRQYKPLVPMPKPDIPDGFPRRKRPLPLPFPDNKLPKLPPIGAPRVPIAPPTPGITSAPKAPTIGANPADVMNDMKNILE